MSKLFRKVRSRSSRAYGSPGGWSLSEMACGTGLREHEAARRDQVAGCELLHALFDVLIRPNHRRAASWALSFALCGAAILAGTRAIAQPAGDPCRRQDLTSLIGQIQRHYEATGSFSASFTEQISPLGGESKTRSGKLYFQRPGKMRWDFAPPNNDTIVSDGTTLYSYQPDLNQVVEVPISKAFSSSAVTGFLLGVGRLEQDFNGSWPTTQPTGGNVAVVLKPKKGTTIGRTVELQVDPRTCAIKGVRLEDQIGNVTKLEFLNSQTNIALDSSLFRFVVPAGADVVQAP